MHFSFPICLIPAEKVTMTAIIHKNNPSTSFFASQESLLRRQRILSVGQVFLCLSGSTKTRNVWHIRNTWATFAAFRPTKQKMLRVPPFFSSRHKNLVFNFKDTF